MNAKQALHGFINSLSEDDAEIVLTFIRRFIRHPYPEGKPLTPEEAEAFKRGEEEFARGEYLTLEEFEQGKRL